MLGVDPIEYLALPRFISAVLMLPILTIFANSAGILAGYFLGVCIFGIPSPLYVNKTLDYLIFSDIIRGLIKSSLFGGIISLLSSFFGFRTKEGAEGLGRSVTAAVVSSYTAILICDYFFTLLLF
jgi:phospholipid/cholesterol/gamma-HCH transport system permease protein